MSVLVTHYLEPLRKWLDHPKTQDVAVNEPGQVWVRQSGSWTAYDAPELNLFWLENLSMSAGAIRHQEVGDHAPILDTELRPDNHRGRLRFNSVLFPQVDTGKIAITIRRHEDEVAPPSAIHDRYDTDGWNQFQIQKVDPVRNELLALYRGTDVVAFLEACVRARQNILLLGGTGAGKTTLLKTLALQIPSEKRIVTVEDAQEIELPNHPNKVNLLFQRDESGENRIDDVKLLRACMRMHPDVVILGEARGPEAWTLINDVLPPHPGSLFTTHGQTPEAGFMRIFGLAKPASGMDDNTLIRFISAAIDVIVPLYESKPKFKFGKIWFIGEAMERGKTASELMWRE